jgi:hypothetical protein
MPGSEVGRLGIGEHQKQQMKPKQNKIATSAWVVALIVMLSAFESESLADTIGVAQYYSGWCSRSSI